MTARAILPGSVIGVLGGGQLGRMFAMAARRLGYRVHTLAPEHDTPTGQIADVEVVASYDDVDRIREFARGVDVVTFEFENVSALAVAAAEAHAIVRPNGRALEIAQHRIREKTFLHNLGLPVTPFAPVRSDVDLADGVRNIGRPAVLKTATFGYDGKGQVRLGPHDDRAQGMGPARPSRSHPRSLHRFRTRVVRRCRARCRRIGRVVRADRQRPRSSHPRCVDRAGEHLGGNRPSQAVEIARAILQGLEYVGVLCVEFFLTKDGRLLINEIAPRPHNSGHLTFDACRTSQFEQQLRAVCGLPLGSPELLQPAAMANLLGDLWSVGEPNWAGALAMPNVKLHLYGKALPRRGRKMGHLTVLAPTTKEARGRVLAARTALSP